MVESAETRAEAFAAAGEALRLDPSLAEANTARATAHAVFDYDWGRAEQGYREAIRLAPSLALAHHGLAVVVHVSLRRFEEALESMERARELDPLSVHVAGELG